MKVVINNCSGAFMLTYNQLKHIRKNIKVFERILLHEVEDALAWLDEHPKEYKTGLNLANEYLYRSHPLIVEAVEKMPTQSQSVVEIDGDVYKIVENNDGSEYVETPCYDGYIRGFKQN